MDCLPVNKNKSYPGTGETNQQNSLIETRNLPKIRIIGNNMI